MIEPIYDDGQATLYCGDALEVLWGMPEASVHAAMTSPPYYGLRDYGVEDQIGLEATPNDYIDALVSVFHELRRVLRSDGTLWVNIGDSYAASHKGEQGATGQRASRTFTASHIAGGHACGMKPKDLMMILARLALALQDDGWWLRSDIIWSKRAPMPESVTDRPTSAHEHVFLLAKSKRYFYDAEAVKERAIKGDAGAGLRNYRPGDTHGRAHAGQTESDRISGRNQRNVWHLGPDPYPQAHFATWPREIPRRAILAGTSEHGVCADCGAPWVRLIERVDTGKTYKMPDGWDTGEGGHGSFHRNGREKGQTGIAITVPITTGWQPTCQCDAPVIPAAVLDPFMGSGRTAAVAKALGRRVIGIDLNEQYLRDFAIPQCQQQSMLLTATGVD